MFSIGVSFATWDADLGDLLTAFIRLTMTGHFDEDKNHPYLKLPLPIYVIPSSGVTVLSFPLVLFKAEWVLHRVPSLLQLNMLAAGDRCSAMLAAGDRCSTMCAAAAVMNEPRLPSPCLPLFLKF